MTNRIEHAALLSGEEVAQAKLLGNLLRSREVAPLIGSGISAGSGLPIWRELVPRIFRAWQDWMSAGSAPSHVLGLTPDQYRGLLGQLFKDDLALTSYIRSQLPRLRSGRRIKFEQLVYGALYGLSETPPAVLTPSPTSIHRHLVAMFSADGGRIWTTNYDDLLEEAAIDANMDVRTLDLVEHGAGNGLQIAHLHGFLAPPKRLKGRRGPSQSRVVLAEDDYHEMTADLIGWTNREFNRLFDEYRVLILGSSLDDPNLRRVLATLQSRTNSTEAARHFAIMRCIDHRAQKKGFARSAAAKRACADDVSRSRKSYWATQGVEIIELPDYNKLLPFLVRVRFEGHGSEPGALWLEGARIGYVAVRADNEAQRAFASSYLQSTIPNLRSDFGVTRSSEIVEIGIFLLQPDGETLELVFSSHNGASRSGARTFSANPDRPTGLAGRVFTSGEGVRASVREPIFNFGLPRRRRPPSGGYEAIISVPIVDWRNGGVPLGVVYLTMDSTESVLFQLPLKSSGDTTGRTIDDLQYWLATISTILIETLRERVVSKDDET